MQISDKICSEGTFRFLKLEKHKQILNFDMRRLHLGLAYFSEFTFYAINFVKLLTKGALKEM